VRVFVLGGTGSIGLPTVRELLKRGHDVWALERSDVSAAKVSEMGATPVSGNIAAPEQWARRLPVVDAVIHAACDFNTEMGAIDRRLLDVLLPELRAQPKKPRFIYTGGCWLFGATGHDIATEVTPFRPLPAFAWMVPHLQLILEAPEVEGIVIHPAMVYEPAGGVFRRFAQDATGCDAIRVVGNEEVRWPLVHSEDLARAGAGAVELYRRVNRRCCRWAHRARLRKTLRHAASTAADRLERYDRRRTRRMGESICARPATGQHESAARSRLDADASRPGT
jgi:nucleoside-diphosphate-sugar epimerase